MTSVNPAPPRAASGGHAGRRILFAAAAGALLIICAAPVAVALLAPVPNIVDTPLVPDEPRDLLHFFPEFSYADHPGGRGAHEARLTLYLADPSRLLEHDQLHVLMRTFDSSPRLVSARLAIVGTDCEYRSAPGARLVDDQVLPLVREPPCAPLRGTPSGVLEFTVMFEGPGRLGVWSRLPRTPTADPHTIYVSERQAQTLYRPALLGLLVRTLGPTDSRRIDLLNYVWQVSATPRWLWTALALALLLMAAGIVAFPWRADRAGSPIAAGAAGFCFAAAITLAYIVIVPPFQAPDEPTHFLSSQAADQDVSLTQKVEAWAQLGHLSRIAYHPLEKFRQGNIGHPVPIPWIPGMVGVLDYEVRTATASRLWRAIRTAAGPVTIPRALLVVRGVHGLLFAVSVGLACAALVWCTRAPGAAVAWFVFLLVPALPFFAMHVAESAVLTPAYVMAAAGALIVFVGGPREHLAGIIIAASAGILFAGARSALPIAPVLFAAMAGRLFVASPSGGRVASRQTLVFWSGMPLGSLVYWIVSTPAYREGWSVRIAGASSSVISLLRSPAAILAGATVVALCGVLAERYLSRFRTSLGTSATAGSVASIAGRMAAAVICSLLIYSAWGTLPHSIPVAAPRRDYTINMFATAATIFRVRDPDVFLAASFWQGFGWLDAMPPLPLTAALGTMTGIAMAVLCWRLGQFRDGRRLAWLALFVCGMGASLLAYALSTYTVPVNLHGRYMIGLYLLGLGIAWSGPLIVRRDGPASDREPGSPGLPPAVLLMLCGALHAYCLSFIIVRYF
jgi:hypothetical protein